VLLQFEAENQINTKSSPSFFMYIDLNKIWIYQKSNMATTALFRENVLSKK